MRCEALTAELRSGLFVRTHIRWSEVRWMQTTHGRLSAHGQHTDMVAAGRRRWPALRAIWPAPRLHVSRCERRQFAGSACSRGAPEAVFRKTRTRREGRVSGSVANSRYRPSAVGRHYQQSGIPVASDAVSHRCFGSNDPGCCAFRVNGDPAHVRRHRCAQARPPERQSTTQASLPGHSNPQRRHDLLPLS